MVDAPFKRKLIEVALPLEAINIAAAREKSIRHGHPSTLHLWWARRPLAACRAVLFASLVDDPSSDPDRFPTPKAVEDERTRLFGIIERLVQWENSTNEAVLDEARAEILRSTGGNPPPVLDPFCGGGSIPLEAQRLGLTAYASDLNPVAVLITKALIEIPPKFAGRAPVHPDARRGVGGTGTWKAAAGLAEDVRRYGTWMRDEAERRIGDLYPSVRLPPEYGGGSAQAIAWIWARTVACPNPACGGVTPLVRSFVLAAKVGGQAWIEPLVNSTTRTVGFQVHTSDATPPEPTVGRRGANCLICGSPVTLEYVKSEGQAKRMGSSLMAIVAEGPRGRAYVSATADHELKARAAVPEWAPDGDIARRMTGGNCTPYGLTAFRDLFTARQLVALGTFSALVAEARDQARRNAEESGHPDPDGYATAVATYLAFGVSRTVDRNNTLCTWDSGPTGTRSSTGGSARTASIRNAFARQALPMTWDYAEACPFSGSGGSIESALDWLVPAVAALPACSPSSAKAQDATQPLGHAGAMISSDPPYYSNIGYADLSDFFYVWLRRSLRDMYPELFGTMLTPKAAELVAAPARFDGSREKAEAHFEAGLEGAFSQMRRSTDLSMPLTLFYAFKQSEASDADDGAVASTGWETMLEGLLAAGFSIDGTWPMRSELGSRMVASGTNALASSIVLVCRPRITDAGITTRRDLVASLKREMPKALRDLQHGNIAPVDLAQSSIGPGMAGGSLTRGRLRRQPGSPTPTVP